MNFEIEAAIVSYPFTVPEPDTLPVFRQELLLITSKDVKKVQPAKNLDQSTMIAFAHGYSYHKRLEDWLGSENVMPERASKKSYQESPA